MEKLNFNGALLILKMPNVKYVKNSLKPIGDELIERDEESYDRDEG